MTEMRPSSMSPSAAARVVLDPTGERSPAQRGLTPRPDAIAGRTVGLLDIHKPRGDVFLDRLEQLLVERGLTVKRYRKPTFTKPAPVELRGRIAQECQLVIEALAD
jgi:hypothetical protein